MNNASTLCLKARDLLIARPDVWFMCHALQNAADARLLKDYEIAESAALQPESSKLTAFMQAKLHVMACIAPYQTLESALRDKVAMPSREFKLKLRCEMLEKFAKDFEQGGELSKQEVLKLWEYHHRFGYDTGRYYAQNKIKTVYDFAAHYARFYGQL